MLSIKPYTPFVWDGSCLGNIIKSNILNVWDFPHKQKLYHLKINGHECICLGRDGKSTHQCICDELKPLFSIRKVGTHWAKHGTKIMIFWRVRTNMFNYVQDELRLNELGPILNQDFIKQVQRIFIFRDIANVSTNFENTIVVRTHKISFMVPYPISYKETTINTEKENSIPNTILKKWFIGVSMSDIAKDIFKITDGKQIASLISKLRGKIQNVINRVDKSQIWLEKYIISRLHDRISDDLIEGPIIKDSNTSGVDSYSMEINNIVVFSPSFTEPDSPQLMPCCHEFFIDKKYIIYSSPAGITNIVLPKKLPVKNFIPVNMDILALLKSDKK